MLCHSQDGKQIETYNFGGRLKSPKGIYIDGDGNRFACGTELFIADSTGELISSKKIDNSAMVVTGDKNGTIYVAESTKNRIAICLNLQ